MNAQDSFREQVQRLVAEGKLTAEEAEGLLRTRDETPPAPPVNLGKPAEAPTAPAAPSETSYVMQLHGDSTDTPPDLRLLVSGYSLSVVQDPAVTRPTLSANRPEELRLSATPEGWRVERTPIDRPGIGLWPHLKAILSLPFVPRHVRGEVNGGNLNLTDLTGEARLDISGGNLRMNRAGSLDADVNGGNLTAGHVDGPADVRVNGGNLTLTHAESLNASVNGGNLRWAGRLVTGNHRVEVNGGNATVQLSPDSSLRVAAEVTVGSFKADFPTTKQGGVINALYQGQLGAGAALLSGSVAAGQLKLVTVRELGA